MPRRRFHRLTLLASVLTVSLLIGTGPATAQKQQRDPSKYLRVQVGSSSKTDVRHLLGEPWRTVLYNDDEAAQENEIWEYRGADKQGPYRIHIEFNQQGIVTVVAKVPEQAGTGTGLQPRS